MHPLTLALLKETLAVCRLSNKDDVPAWVWAEPLFFAARTQDELSLVLPQEHVPAEWLAERDWRAFKVLGPLDFSLTGILASLAAPLGTAGISIFALSTYDTDYLLLKERDLESAVYALTQAGHAISRKGI
jgi:hypothetical protein